MITTTWNVRDSRYYFMIMDDFHQHQVYRVRESHEQFLVSHIILHKFYYLSGMSAGFHILRREDDYVCKIFLSFFHENLLFFLFFAAS